jgi:hypothetical protein
METGSGSARYVVQNTLDGECFCFRTKDDAEYFAKEQLRFDTKEQIDIFFSRADMDEPMLFMSSWLWDFEVRRPVLVNWSDKLDVLNYEELVKLAQ